MPDLGDLHGLRASLRRSAAPDDYPGWPAGESAREIRKPNPYLPRWTRADAARRSRAYSEAGGNEGRQDAGACRGGRGGRPRSGTRAAGARGRVRLRPARRPRGGVHVPAAGGGRAVSRRRGTQVPARAARARGRLAAPTRHTHNRRFGAEARHAQRRGRARLRRARLDARRAPARGDRRCAHLLRRPGGAGARRPARKGDLGPAPPNRVRASCGRNMAAASVRTRAADGRVRLEAGVVPIGWDEGVLHLAGDKRIDADAVVALPKLEGPDSRRPTPGWSRFSPDGRSSVGCSA